MLDIGPFLAAIKANPDCDLARLAFADYCDDNSEYLTDWHRATVEFVRLSCGYGARSVREQGQWVRANYRRLFDVKHGNTRLDDKAGNIWLALSDVRDVRGVGVFDQFSLRLARGFINCVAFTDRVIQWAVPLITSRCPLATFSLPSVLNISADAAGREQVRVYDFAPRAVWQAIEGHSEIASDGLRDFKVFASTAGYAADYARAGDALNAALWEYGERQATVTGAAGA